LRRTTLHPAVSHLPALDPLAVSVMVIKCLSTLRCPLLDVKMPLPDGSLVLVRDELLDAALSGYNDDIRSSMVEHVLANMPPMQAAVLQVSGWAAVGACACRACQSGCTSC